MAPQVPLATEGVTAVPLYNKHEPFRSTPAASSHPTHSKEVGGHRYAPNSAEVLLQPVVQAVHADRATAGGEEYARLPGHRVQDDAPSPE
jgi:hypothetical protein